MSIFATLHTLFFGRMIQRSTLLVICLTLLIAGCSPATSAPTAAPTITPVPTLPPTPTISPECARGSHVYTLVSGGEKRTYILHVPPQYTPQEPLPLVLGFHGNNGYADQFEAYSGFSSVADQAGFFVAYLQGSGEHPSWEAWHGGKDVRFARDLIDKLVSVCNIDPTRIYATGHSLGGGMSNRLACDLAERIAAMGPVSGAYHDPMDCSPSTPVAVVAVHGTADPVIFYDGFGVNGNLPQAYFTVGMPIPQWASAWAKRNGCGPTPSIFFREDPVSGERWSNCRANADVILYTIHDGEHGWPTPTAGFDAAQAIWDFFKQHPRARPGGG